MLQLIKSAAAEQAIQDDMGPDLADLIARCLNRLHAGITVYLSDGIVYLDTDGHYVRVTNDFPS
jgi:hypothetical protein